MQVAPRFKALRRHRAITAISILLAFGIPLGLAIQGLDRPYDAIPDQDLLWASEALRLHSGRGPSYADHPGIYWTLSFLAKLDILPRLGHTLTDAAGNLTASGAETLIKLGRIENGIICGACAASTLPLLRQLRTGKIQELAAILIFSSSTSLLVAVSEIRNEVTSCLFMLTYINLNLWCMRSRDSPAPSKIPPSSSMNRLELLGAWLAILAFLFAAYCKQQVLLLSPLIFAAALIQRRRYLRESFSLLELNNWKPIAAISLLAAAPWLLSASPDIDLINAPFWIFINLGLWATFYSGIAQTQSWRGLANAGLIVAATELIINKLLVFNWWRQAVTGFPSWMFFNANQKDGAEGILAATINYLAGPFNHGAAALFLLATLITALSVSTLKDRKPEAIWILACTSFTLPLTAALAARPTARYEIYFFLPLIIILATLASTHTDTSRANRLAIRLLSICLMALAASASIRNLINPSALINQGQPKSFLCFGQHMDKLMAKTSAGECNNFSKASLDKNPYDSPAGP